MAYTNLFHELQTEARAEDPQVWKVRIEAVHDDCLDGGCSNCGATMSGLHIHLIYVDVFDWTNVGVCSEGCALALVERYDYEVVDGG